MFMSRAFSSIAGVVRSPSITTKVLAPTTGTTAVVNHRSIEEATLNLLQDTVVKEKSRTTTDSAQRYQKIHHEGEVYHPQDLNDAKYRENLRQRRGKVATPTEDPFDSLGLNPLHEYKNFRLLTSFVSDMGKILPREQTGVSAKNQRKLAKAIKRARAMGLMSSTSNQYDFRV
ncbi:ribosomal protein S18 [Pilobolus umbonatus]|nr:ribosomal protein S18 [Pilobolus umbonatus]